MVSISILFKDPGDPRRQNACALPSYLVDLNLDQIINPIVKKHPDVDLASHFNRVLHTEEEISWRQDVFRDLGNISLLRALADFSNKMKHTRMTLSSLERIYSIWHRKAVFLEAAEEYRGGVTAFLQSMEIAELSSAALRSFREFLKEYTASQRFLVLSSDIDSLRSDLTSVRYTVTVKDLTVKVRKYEDEEDFSSIIEDTFSRFSQGNGREYLVKFPPSSGVGYVEGEILACVARLFPHLFARLDAFCENHAGFLDETIDSFEFESRFYISWLEFIEPLKAEGFRFCLPDVSSENGPLHAESAFDLALAVKVVRATHPIVKNGFSLEAQERVIVVTGPNQGGKTTFARVFGQLHHLACIGCPIPAESARLFLFDEMFSHFEREESIKTHRGKLHEELVSIHSSLVKATSRSIFILNEIFTSTTLDDSIFLSKKIMDRIEALDSYCLCVTFLDELASRGEKTVSFVSGVDPIDPSIRTFKVERRLADGLAYARSLAEKRGLTYGQLRERIKG